MEIRDRIHELSVLPSRLNIMLEQALLAVGDTQAREDLCTAACVVSNATWQHWQAWRSPEDNRQEHEWVVFANVMRIAERENLSIEDRRIATAFCFIHDTFSIKRVMEGEIEELKKKGLFAEAVELTRIKKDQRTDHMNGGAEHAEFLLRRLKHPDTQARPLFMKEEVDRCVAIVAEHDSWKLDPPKPPPTSNRLAVACLEGDALWPLHPIGVLADLDRLDKKERYKDLFDPLEWHTQLEQSRLDTLVHFRKQWEEKAKPPIPKADFIDNESIFRTEEGHRLYSEWRRLWNL